jgi:hypothetical protein
MKTRLFLTFLLVSLLLSLVIAIPAQVTLAQKPEPPNAPTPTPTPPLELKWELEHQLRSIGPLSAPSNDDFNAALLITTLPYQHSEDTTAATVASDDPVMGCGAGVNSNTVWYRLVPSFHGLIEANTFGSNYDTVVAVFTGTRGALTRVTCNDDASGSLQSQVTFEVTPNQTYYLEVADYGSPGGGQLRFTVRADPRSILNQYLRTNIASDGRFVIGTTGGDPSTSADDNKRLLFGYPWSIWSSFATLRVVSGGSTTDYQLGKDVAPTSGPSSNGTTLTTVWEVGGVRVEQRLYFDTNPDTGRPDTTAIEYQLTNISTSQRQVGLRLLLDTMIGDNDGAPFFAPGYGNITQERDFSSGSIPDYWIAWESPTFDPNGLKAKGFLRGSGITTPNRLIIAHWDDGLCPGTGPGLFSTAWDYTVNPNISITCDSAVALYYNPVVLNPGQSRTVRTYYGLAGTGGGLLLAPNVVNFVTANRQYLENVSQAASDVSTVGDYFLDKLDSDEVRRVVDIGFNSLDLLTAGISWARVGRGLNHIATPGYRAALHASWRGWVDDRVARHWYKPLYDALHNTRKLLFKRTAIAFLDYYFGEELATEGYKELIKRSLLPGPGTPIGDIWGTPAVQLGDSYRSELLREQDELLARLSVIPLTSDQIAAYRADMLARQQANAQIVAQLGSHRDLLWHSYQKAVADERNWWKFWGPLLLKWGVVGACTLAWDGPGFYIASTGTAAVSTIYDAVQDTRAINHDQKMLDQSLRFLNGRVSMTYILVSQNTVGALNLIRAGDTPQIAGGNVSVQAMKSFGHYRLWPRLWWAEEGSQVELSVMNTKTFSTTYLTSASYNHTSFWAGTERLLPEGQALELSGNSSGMAVIPFKSEEWGASPDQGSTVDLLVLGATETGIYPVASLQTAWNPVRIEQHSRTLAQVPAGYTPEQAAEAPALPYPLSSVVTVLPDSTDYQLTIAVINPFTMTVRATITQALPVNFMILDAGGAQVSGNTLIWTANLEPANGLELQAKLRWTAMPGTSISIPEPILSFRDPSTGLGDTYTAPTEIVHAAWPLAVSANVPTMWQIGDSLTIPITLTNVSQAITAQGPLTVSVTAVDGTLLWSTMQAVNLLPGQTSLITLSIPVPARMGYAIVSGEVRLGTISRQVLEEVIEIRGYRTYLPLVLRDSE